VADTSHLFNTRNPMAIIHPTTMTEHQIQKRLYWAHRKDVLAPNIHLHNWWECDLLRLTPAGYLYEYEIKLTVQDFHADQKKCRYLKGGGGKTRKHDALINGLTCAPNYYHYVLPHTLYLQVQQAIPRQYGVVTLRDARSRPQYVRRGTRLHLHKNENARNQILTSTYHRYWKYKESS